MSKHWRRAALVLALCALAGRADALSAGAERGRHFVSVNCSRCHAVGAVGASPLAAAPPFRTLHQRYRVEDLAEAFAEGITTGHPSMPEFRLDPAQIDDLLEYLRSLE